MEWRVEGRCSEEEGICIKVQCIIINKLMLITGGSKYTSLTHGLVGDRRPAPLGCF